MNYLHGDMKDIEYVGSIMYAYTESFKSKLEFDHEFQYSSLVAT